MHFYLIILNACIGRQRIEVVLKIKIIFFISFYYYYTRSNVAFIKYKYAIYCLFFNYMKDVFNESPRICRLIPIYRVTSLAAHKQWEFNENNYSQTLIDNNKMPIEVIYRPSWLILIFRIYHHHHHTKLQKDKQK